MTSALGHARPNVLFNVADDLSAWIGALGRNPDVRTPHIDRLASRGPARVHSGGRHTPPPPNERLTTVNSGRSSFGCSMTICLLKSKIHRACVTGASVDYEGSLTIASDLAERVHLRPYERILVGNMGNGARFETYVIYGPPGSGVIELNGATAHLGRRGDRLTIMSFAWIDAAEAAAHRPAVIVLDAENRIVRG